MNKKHYIYLTVLIAMLSATCSKDDGDSAQQAGGEAQEIRVNADVWRVMDGTRATTIDTDGELQTTGFKTYVYVDGSTTKYINGSTVSYADSKWEFDDGKHYWPISGSLNFFAHSPKELTNTHCTFDPEPYDAEDNPDGYSDDLARIVCTSLPVAITNNSDATTEELIYAYTPAQNKAGQGASGVTMNFKRPFARIKFQLSAASGTNVTINSITISSIKNNGTCTFDGTTSTWITSGDATNLVITGSPATGDTPYLVIPQTFAANLTFTVNATWDDWSDVTKTVSTTVDVGSWQAGYSYTYTLTLSKYALTVSTEKYTEQW